MYNGKSYETSDAAQPAYVVKNNMVVNPAYPSGIQIVGHPSIPINDTAFLDSMRHRLKRARKKNDREQIRAIKAILTDIQGSSYGI